MPESAWVVTEWVDVPGGRRYVVVNGHREWIVFHGRLGGWQFWNGTARCEPRAGVRAAVLDYERRKP